MKGQPPNYSFSGVDVGLPSKVRGSEAEEEWQEVDWVKWSTGELTVDADSFLLVFKPSGAPGAASVKAKSLGSLIRASAVAPDEDSRTLVVTTSDTLHRLYRLTFESTRNASDFFRLAESAEAAFAASTDFRDPGAESGAEAASKLEADLREKLSGRWPLIYGGAEFYGPDPCGSQGSEVLLGRGAAVLLDPPEEGGRVGTYELLFYGEDEGAREPVKRLTIGPKMSLVKQRAQPEDDDGPAASFQLATGTGGTMAHTLTFDGASIAAGFARDFRVRMRLMDVSLKTVKRAHTADELREELAGMKRRSLTAQLRSLACLVMLLLTLTGMLRLAWLYAKDQGARAPAAYIEALAEDARDAVRMSRILAEGAAAKACELLVGTMPAADVRRCALLAGKSPMPVVDVRRCLEALVVAS